MVLTDCSDDEFLTDQGFLDQPEDRPSVLSGFYYITKLWRSELLS